MKYVSEMKRIEMAYCGRVYKLRYAETDRPATEGCSRHDKLGNFNLFLDGEPEVAVIASCGRASLWPWEVIFCENDTNDLRVRGGEGEHQPPKPEIGSSKSPRCAESLPGTASRIFVVAIAKQARSQRPWRAPPKLLVATSDLWSLTLGSASGVASKRRF